MYGLYEQGLFGHLLLEYRLCNHSLFFCNHCHDSNDFDYFRFGNCFLIMSSILSICLKFQELFNLIKWF